MSHFLKELRESEKLTIAAVTTYLGVTEPTYRSWENGNTTPPFEFIVKLAELYKKDVEYLIQKYNLSKSNVLENMEQHATVSSFHLNLFVLTDSFERFAKMAALEKMANLKYYPTGIAQCDNCIFPFTDIQTNEENDSPFVLLIDEFSNIIPLTCLNVQSVCPVSSNYGVYTYRLQVRCPLFPVYEPIDPNSDFFQTILISFFTRI